MRFKVSAFNQYKQGFQMFLVYVCVFVCLNVDAFFLQDKIDVDPSMLLLHFILVVTKLNKTQIK